MTALLEVRGLTKRYLGLTALDSLSYDVERGAVVGIIGPNDNVFAQFIGCFPQLFF